MQTTGTVLLAVKDRSLTRVLVASRDGPCVHGLLYLAAVQDRGQDHRDGVLHPFRVKPRVAVPESVEEQE
jgi:hypothetical protein